MALEPRGDTRLPRGEAPGRHVLSIHAPTLAAIQEVLELQRRGVTFSSAEAQARAGLTPRTPSPAPGSSIAVIPLMGLLTRRGGGFLSFLFGGTSLSRFSEAVRAASLEVDRSGVRVIEPPQSPFAPRK